ncbi:tRNA pseudouridine synthase A 1 isoform X1 [Juglans microcarpa x Juglans regia]|uniref:tRNA pseudouridine synthase A 1 isoform X1 n=1 Tax=Juglans microcarpa x Juglans regia TaxID=2249226 RepID=UPI001B7D9D30|nr:tRNA pseudouridine synthase A 1 isoform X1 [Juglans microcarpa x Juglans regia]
MSYAVVRASLVPSPSSPPLRNENGSLSSPNNASQNTGGGGGCAEVPTHNTSMPTVSASGYNWRLVIAYDGTRYAGWQYQLSPPTIQCIVEKALTRTTKIERKDLRLVGASRTDAGVHAWGQVAHFVTPFNYDSLESIHAALNGLLPLDIRVREISPAVPEFHARFSAISKIYHYKIYNDAIMDPFQRHCAHHSTYKLNTTLMREAASYFIGEHDFSAFVNASRNDRVPNPVKNIFRFDVIELEALLQLEVEGSGFLYRQVRNMVALLIQIGKGAIPPDIVPLILTSQDRKELAKYALSAPPHGLCLVNVRYNEEHLRLPSGCPKTSFGRQHTVRKCKLPFY